MGLQHLYKACSPCLEGQHHAQLLSHCQAELLTPSLSWLDVGHSTFLSISRHACGLPHSHVQQLVCLGFALVPRHVRKTPRAWQIDLDSDVA